LTAPILLVHVSAHTIRLPADLLHRVRRKAAAEGRSVTALIEDGLRAVLSEHRKPGAGRRVLPRISRAGRRADARRRSNKTAGVR
jgi:hypothetical protein